MKEENIVIIIIIIYSRQKQERYKKIKRKRNEMQSVVEWAKRHNKLHKKKTSAASRRFKVFLTIFKKASTTILEAHN